MLVKPNYHDKNQGVPPPIPFKKVDSKKPKKGMTHKLGLKVDPTDKDSNSYEIEVVVFDSGTPEEWLDFLDVWKKVEKGLRLTAAPTKAAVFKNLIRGEALQVFENSENQLDFKTNNDDFVKAVQKLTEYFFPIRALETQKRFMRRNLLKVRGQTIREFVARIQELNSKLEQFPPFKPDQAFKDDKLVEIIEYSLPAVWQRKMRIQGFVPQDKTVLEILKFCERMEIVEALPRGLTTNTKSSKNNKKRARENDVAIDNEKGTTREVNSSGGSKKKP